MTSRFSLCMSSAFRIFLLFLSILCFERDIFVAFKDLGIFGFGLFFLGDYGVRDIAPLSTETTSSSQATLASTSDWTGVAV